MHCIVARFKTVKYVYILKNIFAVFVSVYLDNFDDETEGEGHGEEDEEDGDEDQQVSTNALTLLTG